MSKAEFANWLALYVATFICCLVSTMVTVGATLHQVLRDRPWAAAKTVRARLLLVPAIWWQWQKTYLLTTPVTLSIITMFAFSLDWSQ